MSRYQSVEQIITLSNEMKELRQELRVMQSTIQKLCSKDTAKNYYNKNKSKIKEMLLHMESILTLPQEAPAVAIIDDTVEEEIPEEDMSMQEEELYYEDDFELLDDDLLEQPLQAPEPTAVATNSVNALDNDVERLLHVGVISFYSL